MAIAILSVSVLRSHRLTTAICSCFLFSFFLESWLLTTAWGCPSFICLSSVLFSPEFFFVQFFDSDVLAVRLRWAYRNPNYVQTWTCFQWKTLLPWFNMPQTVHGGMQNLTIRSQWCVSGVLRVAWSAQHICSHTREVHIMRLRCREQQLHCTFVV